MCSQRDSKNSSASSGGLSVGVPIEEIPVKFGGNLEGSAASAWFEKYCSVNSSSITDQQAAVAISSIVPSGVVPAWQGCMAAKFDINKSERLSMETTVNDPVVTVRISWRPDALRTDAPVATGNLLAIGATCENPIQKGQTLTASQIVVCTRTGKSAMTFVLNTSQGSVGPANVPALLNVINVGGPWGAISFEDQFGHKTNREGCDELPFLTIRQIGSHIAVEGRRYSTTISASGTMQIVGNGETEITDNVFTWHIGEEPNTSSYRAIVSDDGKRMNLTLTRKGPGIPFGPIAEHYELRKCSPK